MKSLFGCAVNILKCLFFYRIVGTEAWCAVTNGGCTFEYMKYTNILYLTDERLRADGPGCLGSAGTETS